MEIKPTVKRITIYPVKSLDGISLQKAQIVKGGCLMHDREYAIIDINGNFIIGKTNALVHSLRSKIDFDSNIISLRHESGSIWKQFHLQKEKPSIDDYLSAFFNIRVTLAKNAEGRFLDIPDISGMTVLSTASLETVAAWFNNMDPEEVRKRFRATIEIGDVPAFWEDNLFYQKGTAVEFKMGAATLLGISPRARCVVPTRHPQTGEVIHGFPKSFTRHRAATLPEWSTLNEYGHHYFLTVNCYIPATEIGKFIKTGDKVLIIGEKVFY